jgi:hypothetical protein
LHDLDEASLVGIALNVDGDVSAVAEGSFAVEGFRCLGPPPVLFGTIAVAAGILFRVKADYRDGTAIFSDPACTAKPSSRARRKILKPSLDGIIQRLRVGRLSLDDLSEHGEASDR